ncbi:flagellar basal body P-ring protein FlgI [Rhizobiales bacterium TNE-4]|nr:flagellar basal body P-ring protein FlgI [Rhizobiales bacterium TNE-4]MBV1828626.1 flagellar basal body P-ring protein FlgI [Rhizobiales bacterium TNE-4]
MRIFQALRSFVLVLGVMASVATPVLAQQQVAARSQRPDLQDRIKDMVTIGGIRPNQLVGYGLVVGLNGTGDGSVPVTNQTLQSLVARFGINVDAAGINPKNAAAVMVTAELPAFAKPGQRLDVTVSAFGKATSLRGGSLLMTQLVGADNETYAMAQGNLAVGGLGITGADGSKVSVNIPTVGRIPGGGTVERMVPNSFDTAPALMLNLMQPDFTNSNRIAAAINRQMGNGTAQAIDSMTVKVNAPKDADKRVAFMSQIEEIKVGQSLPPARVIVNSRTGTIVISEGVRVTPAAVSHGSLTVRVKENLNVSQPNAGVNVQENTAIGNNANAGGQPPGGQTVVTRDSQIGVDQQPARTFLFAPDVPLSSIVDAVNAVGASPSDLVAILEALRQAGALHAELVII